MNARHNLIEVLTVPSSDSLIFLIFLALLAGIHTPSPVR